MLKDGNEVGTQNRNDEQIRVAIALNNKISAATSVAADILYIEQFNLCRSFLCLLPWNTFIGA